MWHAMHNVCYDRVHHIARSSMSLRASTSQRRVRHDAWLVYVGHLYSVSPTGTETVRIGCRWNVYWSVHVLCPNGVWVFWFFFRCGVVYLSQNDERVCWHAASWTTTLARLRRWWPASDRLGHIIETTQWHTQAHSAAERNIVTYVVIFGRRRAHTNTHKRIQCCKCNNHTRQHTHTKTKHTRNKEPGIWWYLMMIFAWRTYGGSHGAYSRIFEHFRTSWWCRFWWFLMSSS